MPIPWRNYSVLGPHRRANCGFLHSAARLPGKDLHAHPAAISSTSMIPRPTVSFLHFSSPTRSASSFSHPLVGRSFASDGKFSRTLFINTDHLSRIARGSSSSLVSTNNRLVKLLRRRLSRLCEVDHHRLSCHERVWLHTRSTGCPENPGNTLAPTCEIELK